MKKNALSKRIISILLVLVMAANTPLAIWADTLVIDNSGFTNPTITKGTVYYWHKGAPPATLDGTSYPVIMAWDDKYYLAADNTFHQEITGPNKSKYALDCVSPRIDDDDDTQDVNWDGSSSTRPCGYYHKNREYSGHPVSELPFDYNVLKKTGTAVSFGAPNLPRFVAVDVGKTNSTAPTAITSIGVGWNNDVNLTLKADTEQSYAIWFPNPVSGDTMGQKKYWLTGTHRIYSYYDELDDTIGTEARYVNSLDWFLDEKVDTQANFTDINRAYTPAHNGLNSRGHEARPPKTFLRDRTWRVTQIQDSNQYFIDTEGGADALLKSFYASSKREDLKNYVMYAMGPSANISLMHVNDKLMSVGERGGPETQGWAAGLPMWAVVAIVTLGPAGLLAYLIAHNVKPYKQDLRFEDQADFLAARPNFDLYWGEPATISFCQLDFTVQTGQVQTFDGPIAIGHDATITIEDGGVLACSD
ncbi:MAG: hypothetical protein J6X24_08945, partial [Firmicutes bacterium]|nr:hypothetical protein [Bacillota bacterium]